MLERSIPRVLKLNCSIPQAHQRVFDCLRHVKEENRLPVVLRVAGGWVRDTLLGLHSNDIDIAIETLGSDDVVSGEQFARAVSAYQARHGDREHTVGVIRVNPALSKHIETATVNVLDLPVEFCALRADDYCSESRIPKVRVGTLCEDAQRRDFTINALFYNLDKGEVEDYTTGLGDLEARVIRCPLQPADTFKDDPLRLLRGVRFAGQLGPNGFRLDPSIPQCVDDSLLDVLLAKVSRERIGKEFVKMLTGPCPTICIDLLLGMCILQRILLVEVHLKSTKGKREAPQEVERIVRLVGDTAATESDRASAGLAQVNRVLCPLLTFQAGPLALAKDDVTLALLFALAVPFYRGVSADELQTRIPAFCVNALKLPSAFSNAMNRMLLSYNVLLSHHFSMADVAAIDQLPAKMKVFDALAPLNDKCVPADAFRVVLLMYLVLECAPHLLASGAPDDCFELLSSTWQAIERQAPLLDAYRLDLPIKGNELKKIIAIEPKEIGPTLLEVRKMVVFNPSLSRDDVIQHLQARARREDS